MTRISRRVATVLAVVALGSGSIAARPAPMPQTDAASILRRAESAYKGMRSFQADFIQDLTVPILNQTQHGRGKLYARQPGRFSMRFTEPAGDLVVADGRYVWLYYPSADKKQVIRATLAESGAQINFQEQFLNNAAGRFDATLNGTESVGGRPAQLLTLVPKRESGYQKVRIWVDAADALVRRFEITEANESVRRLELVNLKPNAAVPDRFFTFTPPPGTQVFTQ